jgi:hypothetical protein
MIYNQHDWDQDGYPLLDQDMTPGYKEIEEGIELSSEERRFIWALVILALIGIIGAVYACVSYAQST